MSANYVEASIYLPGIFSANQEKPEPISVPILSNKTVEIFSVIQPTLHNSNELFQTMKPINISATELTSAIKELHDAKEFEFSRKFLCIAASVGALLLAAAFVTAFVVSVVFTAGATAMIITAALIGPFLLGFSSLSIWGACILMISSSKNPSLEAQNKVNLLIDETIANHGKLKEYFIENHQTLRNNIEKSIEDHNTDIKLIKSLNTNYQSIENDLLEKINDLRNAQEQLENFVVFILRDKS